MGIELFEAVDAGSLDMLTTRAVIGDFPPRPSGDSFTTAASNERDAAGGRLLCSHRWHRELPSHGKILRAEPAARNGQEMTPAG
jgi:hypothetical protein